MEGIAIIAFVGSWLLAGTTAWNWVEPSSFGTALIFLIVWAILTKVFDLIIGGVLFMLFANK